MSGRWRQLSERVMNGCLDYNLAKTKYVVGATCTHLAGSFPQSIIHAFGHAHRNAIKALPGTHTLRKKLVKAVTEARKAIDPKFIYDYQSFEGDEILPDSEAKFPLMKRAVTHPILIKEGQAYSTHNFLPKLPCAK
ncbi:hypothetical protein IFR04_015952 [Cadophora malorum]|uniref:Uncharacterized protein n=1 Tax=Cadophora malorum TaxID=108018 RepID=A0A8H7W3G4_9HELO|nr:hypothetical protein IFR04_015952 [Cadophora malorum]